MRRLSIVIPCLNEEQHIGELLDSLEQQSIEKSSFEVIVVNNASRDDTEAVVRAHRMRSQMTIKLLNEPQAGVSRARNTGARHADAEWIFFLDADNVVPPDFLACSMALLNSSEVGASTIATLSNDDKPIHRTIFGLLEWVKSNGFRPFGKSMVRRDLFVLCGGFNVDIQLGENVDFLCRVKKACIDAHLQFAHIRHPIRCSPRRFEKHGYAATLAKWLLAYMGLHSMKYKPVNH